MLRDKQRDSCLHWGASRPPIARALPSPDVALLVLDDEKLNRSSDEKERKKESSTPARALR
jgi:hypothetical protein